MAREQINKTLDGHTFEITQLGAVQGSKVFVHLLSALAPLFANGTPSLAGLKELKDEQLTYLCDAFSPMTIVDGRPLKQEFDLFFAGRYGLMFLWLGACIEHNFADVLAKTNVGKVVGVLTKGASPSSFPLTATGVPGAS